MLAEFITLKITSIKVKNTKVCAGLKTRYEEGDPFLEKWHTTRQRLLCRNKYRMNLWKNVVNVRDDYEELFQSILYIHFLIIPKITG